MKRKFSKSTLMTLIALIAFSGCEFRKDREAREAEAKKQAEKQQKQDEQKNEKTDSHTEEEARRAEANKKAVEKARVELRARAALYNTVAGRYEGTYLGKERTVVPIVITVSTANVPTPAELDRITRESEVLERMNSISVEIQTEEKRAGASTGVYCTGRGVKPDFARGLMQFDCSGSSGSRRDYNLHFASGDLKEMDNDTPETKERNSARIGNDLVGGQLAQLGGIHLLIVMNADFGGSYKGMLSRKPQQQ